MHLIVGGNLRLIRKQKGLTQEQTAEALNISQAAYARIENGKTNSWSIHLSKICEVFNCKPENLFDNASLENIIEKNNDNKLNDSKIISKLIEQFEFRLKEKDEIIIALTKKDRQF